LYEKLYQEQFDLKFPPQSVSRTMGDGPGHAVPAPASERPALPFDPHASQKGSW
jgi:hypothetical protein